MPPKKNEKKPASPTKTEIVTLRLDPKTRYGLELLSRKQYRTISSVVEWVINEAIRSQDGIASLDEIWDVEEADRLVKLAMEYPNLLNYEEQIVWKYIREYDYFWNSPYRSDPDYVAIRRYFNDLVEISRGNKKISDLPDFVLGIPVVIDNLDEY